MAAIKKIKASSNQGRTLYAVIQRESDEHIMDNADGSFTSASFPANYGLLLTEDTDFKGFYLASESRTVWTDNTYNIFIYNRLGGSPAIATDTPLGNAKVQILSDAFVEQTGDSFARLGAPVGASISADIAAVQADTDNIQTRLPAALVGGRMDSSVGAMAADTITASALATSAVDEIVDGVWDEALAGHMTAGTTGKALSDAGAVSADPWLTALPGAYIAGSAGFIVGTNIDATTSSRASAAALSTAQTDITAIKTVTDVLPNAGTLSTIQSDLDDIQTRLPAVLVGGKMDSNLASITAGVDLSATMKASVNAEVVDVINTDTSTELSAVPSATAPLRQQIQFSYQAIRNKNTTSTTQNKLYKDDGTVFATAPVADSGILFTKDEFA